MDTIYKFLCTVAKWYENVAQKLQSTLVPTGLGGKTIVVNNPFFYRVIYKAHYKSKIILG